MKTLEDELGDPADWDLTACMAQMARDIEGSMTEEELRAMYEQEDEYIRLAMEQGDDMYLWLERKERFID